VDVTNGKSKSKIKIKRPTKPDYLYSAEVRRVIDGDTLLVDIDLGLNVWSRKQRSRLANVDTPAIETKKGRAAFEFVRNKLANAYNVVIRTNKQGVHGRYVVDVFYSPIPVRSKHAVFNEGRYLNQELLDRGLAKRL
jgi:endonuclease YncB( thermonuclease family)